MTNQHLNNLLFLLAGSSLALACDINVNDDDTGAGTAAGTGADDGMNTTGADDGVDDGVDEAGTTVGSTAGDDVVDEGSGDTGVATTGGGYTACFFFAKNLVECSPDLDQTEEYNYCEMLLDYYGAYGKECLGAVEEFYACLGNLDCASLEDETGCDAETAAVVTACPEPPGGSSGSGTAGG